MIKLDRKLIVGASVGLTLLAVACGSDDAPAAQSNPTATPVTTAPTATSAPVDIPVVTPAARPDATAVPDAPAVFAWSVETVDEGTKPALALSSDGTPTVADELRAMQRHTHGVWTTVAFGPLLVQSGRATALEETW